MTLPFALSLLQGADGGVDRHGEPKAVVASAGRGDLLVDADDLALTVDQRTAGVALVDGGVRLDAVGDRLAVRRFEAPPRRRDDARRDGEVVAERVADGHDGLADGHVVGVAERQRVEVDLARIDLDDRDVAADVDADELTRDALGLGAALVEHHGDAAGALAALVHDVRVGEDVALLVDHEAGAERLGALRLAELVGARAAEIREDHHDATGEVAVDLLRRERAAGRGWGAVDGGGLRRGLNDRLVDLPEVEDEHQQEDDGGCCYGAAGKARQESFELHACFPSFSRSASGRAHPPALAGSQSILGDHAVRLLPVPYRGVKQPHGTG